MPDSTVYSHHSVSLLQELYNLHSDGYNSVQAYSITGGAMAVYGYTRVSTDRQADEGESLGAQQRTLEGYAMMHGMKIDRLFIERGVSGSKKLSERPCGSELLATVKAGDVVLTPKLDRMFRSALDALEVLAQLQKRSVSLHMIDLGGDVTTNGISKLVFTILSAVAEAERDRIRERIRDVKADQKKRSRYLGGSLPFGWTLGEDMQLVREPRQQAAIKHARKLKAEGKSLRTIAKALSEEHGLMLSHVGVANVLKAGQMSDPA